MTPNVFDLASAGFHTVRSWYEAEIDFTMWRIRLRRQRPTEPVARRDSPEPDLQNPVEFDTDRYEEQMQSPLFRLPAEIRALIFEYTLRDFENAGRRYEDALLNRPGHRAATRADTNFLRTCQRAYQEAWFVPYASTEHTLYLTLPERQPPWETRNMQAVLRLLAARHGYTELSGVQVIAQMWLLEPGHALQRILDWRDFHPRRLTITIRHTDWWLWETDAPLSIDSPWVNGCRFPASLRELRVELETLVRKKHQVETLAERMRDRWVFERKDGVRLAASRDIPFHTYNWSGSSTLRDYRWLEDESRPETLDYHVVFVSFRPTPEAPPEDPSKDTRPFLQTPALAITDVAPTRSATGAISLDTLRKYNIPPGTSAEDVLRLTGGDLGPELDI